MRNKILVGDCRKTLQTVPAKSVHTCVTSPPYFGLRDYGHDSQIGLEETPQEFVAELVKVLSEVHRVLRDDGTLWVNIGDSYNGSGSTGGKGIQQTNNGSTSKPDKRGGYQGLKQKDLIGIPWMLAFALRDWGWYLRQDIIWSKPAPMPSSVRDRCTTSHEYVFLLSKSKSYFYDQYAISEECVSRPQQRITNTSQQPKGPEREVDGVQNPTCQGGTSSTRNKRSVWTVNTHGYKGAHFAVFPTKLIEPCILAGSPEQCCSSCGMPYERKIEQTRVPTRPGTNSKVNRASANDQSPYESNSGMIVGNRDPRRHITATKTIGFEPACECGVEPTRGTVLDPFAGSGTTAQVAQNNGRDWIMCEANSDYISMIERRTEQPLLF